VCYARASIVFCGLCFASFQPHAADARPFLVIAVYTLAMALDGVDGCLARRLGQESEFGAALDVLVDNFSRGGMWVAACGCAGTLPLVLEMLVLVCTHTEGGGAWKTGCFVDAPKLVAAVMSNGFRSPLGALTVAGLHFLPLWLWSVSRLPTGHPLASWWLGAAMVTGRSLGFVVEVWIVSRHAGHVLDRDAVALHERQAKRKD
ncbi:unnamed protein product, partial [Polarella glacialis]